MLPFWPRKYYHRFVLLLFVFKKHRLRRAANSVCSTEAMLPELQVPRTNWGDAECMFPMGTHTCPVPVWPARMKAAYWKKPCTCIQMWVDPSSSQGRTLSLSSHCSHHPWSPLATHKHVHGGVSLVAGLDLMVPPVANVQTQWSLPCPDQAHGDLPSCWPAGPARGQQRWCGALAHAQRICPSLSLASGPWIRFSCCTQTPSMCTKKPPHPGEGLETVLGEETGQPALVGILTPHQPLLLSARRGEP